MSPAQARWIRTCILSLCVAALVMIFQPFSMTLFSIGAGLVVLGGLAFNLVPIAIPGNRLEDVLRAAVIVLAVFVVAVLIAVGSAELYKLYLKSA